MHNLVVSDIIPMPMVFIAEHFVAVALSSVIIIFVFVAMFIVIAPVSMIFMLSKSHAGA